MYSQRTNLSGSEASTVFAASDSSHVFSGSWEVLLLMIAGEVLRSSLEQKAVTSRSVCVVLVSVSESSFLTATPGSACAALSDGD